MKLSASNLKEGKIFILVDLHCKYRVSRGLSKTTQTHLGIEEVHHRLLRRREGVNKREVNLIHGEVINKTRRNHIDISNRFRKLRLKLTSVIPNGMLPT